MGARQRAHQRDHRALGRGVDMLRTAAPQRRARGHDDHRAATAADDLRDRVSAAEHRAAKVQPHRVRPHAIEPVGGELRHAPVVVERAARAVEQHVQPAEAVAECRDRRAHRVLPGDVGGNEQRLVAQGCERLRCLSSGRLVDVEQRHARALAREGLRGGAADAGRRAGDHGYLSGQAAHRASVPRGRVAATRLAARRGADRRLAGRPRARVSPVRAGGLLASGAFPRAHGGAFMLMAAPSRARRPRPGTRDTRSRTHRESPRSCRGRRPGTRRTCSRG